MSREFELLKAKVAAISEGLSSIVEKLTELEQTYQTEGAGAVAVESAVREALAKARPMKEKVGLWMPAQDAPDLKQAILQADKKRLQVFVDGQGYNISLYGGEGGGDFISFWPMKKGEKAP